MIDQVSVAFVQLYIDHMSLLATVFCAKAFMNVCQILLPSQRHYLNFLKSECHLCSALGKSLSTYPVVHCSAVVTQFVVSIEVAAEVCCCDISLYSVVEQRLKCNTSEKFNSVIQFSLTMVLSIEERVLLVEHVFREGNRFRAGAICGKFPEIPVTHHNAVCSVCEELCETGSVSDAE
jgi:hypothetical protein